MNSLKKIQAFTLGELLIVMVISSIVVTLSFMALGNIQRQIRGVNQTFERQQKILQLERMLFMDLHVDRAVYSPKDSTMTFEKGKELVQYKYLNGNIVRQQDTIDLQMKNMILYLNGEKVNDGDFDAVEIMFSDTYNQQGFFIYKRKDASYYINQ